MEENETPTTDAKIAEPILIDQFEGEYVRLFEGKLPGLTITMPEGYARNTHLKLMVEVRVRQIGYPENKSGELTRKHELALENIELVGAYTPDELDPGVGGNASAASLREDDDTPDPGAESNVPAPAEIIPDPFGEPPF